MDLKKIYRQSNLAIQELSYTCGPTSLLNVLRLKGDDSYTERQLAELCKSNRKDGTTHEGLVDGAQKAGLKVVEHKENAELKDIERNVDAGAYVIVNYFDAWTGYGHYSVITEYDSKSYYIRDCFFGLFRMEKRILDKWWYGRDGIKRWYLAVK